VEEGGAMKLTLTNRIIIAVAGLFVLSLLLFPPSYVDVGAGHRLWWGHRFVAAPPMSFFESARIDVVPLILEIAAVLVAAAILMLLLGALPKPKPDKDK
jgi:hypothetical protein